MFDLQPALSDKLVAIRPLHEADRDSLYDVASDPLIWEQHQQKDRWKKPLFNLFFDDSLHSGGALSIIDRGSKQLIGSTRFNPIKDSSQAIEIGWSFLARRYWGGKYNFAVKSLLINHAFQFVNQVVFYINEHNIRSQKSVQKLGAERIDDFPHRHPFMSRKETFIFVINMDTWQAIQKL